MNHIFLIRPLIYFIGILILANCDKEPYTPTHESKYAVYSILDPDQPIELYIWESTVLGELPESNSGKIIEILENEDLHYIDTIFTDYLHTPIIPEMGKKYIIKVSDIQNIISTFISRPILPYHSPEIISYTTNDSVASLGPGYSQTLQQIEIITDQTINDSPYYAYQMIADSLPFDDERPVNLTSGWFRRSGYNCPEIAESPFLDENYRIVNLTCFEEENLFSIESGNHRPGEIDFVRFTLCNFDNHTMDFARWMYQNSLLQIDNKILQIFNTKDNFANETGYDFVLNRTCKELILDFN